MFGYLQDVFPGVSDPLSGRHRYGAEPNLYFCGLHDACCGREQRKFFCENGFTNEQPHAFSHRGIFLAGELMLFVGATITAFALAAAAATAAAAAGGLV